MFASPLAGVIGAASPPAAGMMRWPRSGFGAHASRISHRPNLGLVPPHAPPKGPCKKARAAHNQGPAAEDTVVDVGDPQASFSPRSAVVGGTKDTPRMGGRENARPTHGKGIGPFWEPGAGLGPGGAIVSGAEDPVDAAGEEACPAHEEGLAIFVRQASRGPRGAVVGGLIHAVI